MERGTEMAMEARVLQLGETGHRHTERQGIGRDRQGRGGESERPQRAK